MASLHIAADSGASGPLANSDSERIISRMETLEGQALERFATGWLAGLPDVSWTGFGIWRWGLPDIDEMAVQGEGRDQTLVLGGCQRNADALDTALCAHFFNPVAGTGDKIPNHGQVRIRICPCRPP